MVNTIQRILPYIIITFIGLAVWVLHAYPLFPGDEPSYITPALTLTKLFHPFHIVLNGVPYWEKPPMIYWIDALGLWIHPNVFTERFFPAISFIILLWVLYIYVQNLYDKTLAYLITVGYATLPFVNILATYNSLDMGLTLFITLALLSFYHAYIHSNKWYRRLGFVWIGCAFLTKGLLAGVFTWGIFGVFLLIEQGFLYALLWFLDPIAFVLLLGILSPWIIMVLLNPGYFIVSIWVHHIGRFLGLYSFFTPNQYNYASNFWYMLPIFTFPWTIALYKIKTLWHTLKQDSFLRLCALWVLFFLVFFSLPRTTLPTYILPAVLPAVIILIRVHKVFFKTHIQLIYCILAGVLNIIIGYSFYIFFQNSFIAYVFLGVINIGFLIGLLLANMSWRIRMLVGFVWITVLGSFELFYIHKDIFHSYVTRDFLLALQTPLKNKPVAIYHYYDPTLNIYLNKNIIRVIYPWKNHVLYPDNWLRWLTEAYYFQNKPLPNIKTFLKDKNLLKDRPPVIVYQPQYVTFIKKYGAYYTHNFCTPNKSICLFMPIESKH